MRIGLVCPYSLTVYGGVQTQVLGLARSLRASGHDARVLAPCDGPPPDSGVTPLGNSIPTAANGSVAPLAPDAPAQLRFIRAVRDEGFDVLHLHEPLAPGATMTACVLRPRRWSARSTRPGHRPATDGPDPACAGWPGASTSGARCQTTRRRWRRRTSGAPTSRCSTASRSTRTRRREPTPDRRTDDPVPRPSRGPQGPVGPARRDDVASPRGAAVGGRRRARDRAPPRPGRRGSPHRVAGPDHRGREALAAPGRRRLLRAIAARRVLRRRAPGGDGGIDRDRRERPAPATAGWPGPTWTPCSCRPATPRRWPARSTPC